MIWTHSEYGDVATAFLAGRLRLEVFWSSDRSKPGYIARFCNWTLAARFENREEAQAAIKRLVIDKLNQALRDLESDK